MAADSDSKGLGKCDVCGATVRESELEQHARKWHPGATWLSRPQREAILRRMRRQPQPSTWVRCPVCNKRVPAKGLDDHMRAKHAQPDPAPQRAAPCSGSKATADVAVTEADEDRVLCEKCGKRVGREALDAHMARHHAEARKQAQNARRFEHRVKETVPVLTRGPIKLHPEPRRVVLCSQKCVRVDRHEYCRQCGVTTRPVWRFARSNVGPVFLCAGCMAEALDRCFRKKDAMDGSVSDGGFDTNRHRH